MVFQNTVISGYYMADDNTKVRVKDTVYNLCQNSFYGQYPEQIFMDKWATVFGVRFWNIYNNQLTIKKQ